MKEQIKNDAANAIRAWGKASPSKEDAIDLLATLYTAIWGAESMGESSDSAVITKKIGNHTVDVTATFSINAVLHDKLCDITCLLVDQPVPKVSSREEIEFELEEDRKALMRGEPFNEGLYGW